MARTIRPSDTDLSPNPELRSPQHWVLLVYDGNRSYAGNPGYSDIPSEQYHFDSSVPNHKRLRDGDIVATRLWQGRHFTDRGST